MLMSRSPPPAFASMAPRYARPRSSTCVTPPPAGMAKTGFDELAVLDPEGGGALVEGVPPPPPPVPPPPPPPPPPPERVVVVVVGGCVVGVVGVVVVGGQRTPSAHGSSR